VKKAKCVTIDVALLAEAEHAAARLGVTFSALVEEALRCFLGQAEAWRGVEERLTRIETLIRQCLQKEARREPPEAGKQAPPPQLGGNIWGNVWVEILRRRG
jgi:hypothetical protein